MLLCRPGNGTVPWRTVARLGRTLRRSSKNKADLALRAPPLRDLLPLLAGFRKADGDGLLAAFHRAAPAALPALERSTLAPVHGALDVLGSRPRISSCH